MKNVFLENGLRVFKSVLDWSQGGKEESDTDRRNDYSAFGILSAAEEEFAIIVGDNDNPPATNSINVRPGISYDSNGERVVIEGSITPYDPSAPTSTSPDGKGGTVVTPQSTGSQNIVLTPNVVNYIWIDYLATRDVSEFSLQKITNKKLYYKQDNGFRITVTLVDIPPTLASIKLGQVDLTGGGVVSAGTIDQTSRVFGGVKVGRTLIKVGKFDRSDATTSYNFEDELFLDNHVKAIGTGTVSATNPHGLAPIDIGINTAEILEIHQKFLHSSGIVGDPLSTTTSLYLEHVPISPGEDFVRIKPIDTDELVEVDGITINSNDIPSEVTLLFSSVTDPTNTYYVFVNKNTKTVQRSSINPIGDDTKLPLWSFLWTSNLGAPNDGNISLIVDMRVFGNIATREIQDGAVTSDKLGGRITLPNNTVSAPAYSFSAEDNSGFYRAGVGDLRFSVLGTDKFIIDSSKITPSVIIRGIDGSISSPTYSFTSQTNTGIYLSDPNLAITTEGIQRAVFSSAGLDVNAGQIHNNVNGTLSVPSLAIGGTGNIGVYSTGANNLSITTNGIRRASFDSSNITFDTAQVIIKQGSASVPSLTFLSDLNTGIYSDVADSLRIAAGGNVKLTIGTTNANFSVNGRFPDGSVSVPSVSFVNGTNTGMYLAGASSLGFSAGNDDFLIAGSGEVQIRDGWRLQTIDTGSVGDPVILRNSDPDTGLYWGTNEINFSAGSNQALNISTNGLQTRDNGYKFLTGSSLGMEKSGTTLILRTAGAATPFSIANSGAITSNATHDFLNTGMTVVSNQVLPILQVVRAVTNTVTNTTSIGFANTASAVTITPKFATSKILVISYGAWSSETDHGYATLARGTTNLAPNNVGFHHGRAVNNYNISMEVYDSPGTTSAVTYRVRQRSHGGGTVKYPADSGVSSGPAAVITAIEIAQ